jgi:hypothetical protein
MAKPARQNAWSLPRSPKTPKQDIWSLPPEGLWISPSGQRHGVNEHLLAIRELPEEFGLSGQEVRGLDLDAIRQLAEGLIATGWTRYRYLDGVYHFEVDGAKKKIGVIDDVLSLARAIPLEQLVITQRLSPRTFKGTVGDFLDRTVFRLAKKNVKADSWAWTRVG